MSAAVVVSSYLAGVALRGASERDGVETQARAEVATDRAASHAAITIDVVAPRDTFRDVDAGIRLDATARVRVVAEAHALDDGIGDRGGALYGGAAVRTGAWDAELGAATIWYAGEQSGELFARGARRGLGRIDLAATAIVTAGDRTRVSVGGEVIVHAGPAACTIEGLAGERARALLAHGQWLEATGGVQHGWARATASLDLGRLGSTFVSMSMRDDTDAHGNPLTVTVVVAGVARPL